MKMRLMGTLEELQDLRQVLQQVEALELLEMSAPYPNRGRQPALSCVCGNLLEIDFAGVVKLNTLSFRKGRFCLTMARNR